MVHDSSVCHTVVVHQLDSELQIQKEKDTNTPQLSKRSLAGSVAIIATCTAAVAVDVSNSTAVAISLSDIERSIGIREVQLQWLLSAYFLSAGCLLLPFGRLADLYGPKKVFLIGMLYQSVCSLSIGFAKDGVTMDILRGFQGVGAAAAIPSALGILSRSFTSSRMRSLAFATFAAGAPIGAAFGMSIGGLLTQLTRAHWRASFFLIAGMSALCVLGGLASFEPDPFWPHVDTRVDWIGAVLVTVGLVLIVFVLGQAPITGWKTPYIIICLIVGLVLVGLFIIWELRLEKSIGGHDKPKSFWTPPPLMKPSIWSRGEGRMAVMLIIAFLNCCGFACWTFWVQLYYQNYLRLDRLHTIVRFIPMYVSGCLCNAFVGMAVSKLPLVIFIVVGNLITGFACVLFALIDPTATYWAYGFPSTIMVVVGTDFVYSTGTLFVSKIAPLEDQSLAGGLFQTMTQIGTAFGLTISTVVFNSMTHNASLLEGYKSALWTGAAFSFLAASLGAIFLRKVGSLEHKCSTEDIHVTELTVNKQLVLE